MPKIFYINSSGEKIEFDDRNFVLCNKQALFEYSWDVNLNDYSNKVGYFSKSTIEKTLSIIVIGNSKPDLNYSLDLFDDVVEHDIVNKKQGKLFCGDYYLPCFIVACDSASRSNDGLMAKRTIKILSEDGMWMRATIYGSRTLHNSDDEAIKYFNDYDYTIDARGSNVVTIENTSMHNAEIRIVSEIYDDNEELYCMFVPYDEYRPDLKYSAVDEGFSYYEDVCTHSIGVLLDFDYENSDTLEINTIEQKIISVDKEGNETNAFAYRDINRDYALASIETGKYVFLCSQSTDKISTGNYNIIVLEKFTSLKGGVECI